MNASDVTRVLGTLAIGACAVILALRGDVAHALTFAALLVPNLGGAGILGAAIDRASSSSAAPPVATVTATTVEIPKP